MRDALALFTKISENAEKRAYVLGTMAELGLASHPHHKDVGSHIQPRENDIAVLVGAFAEVYKTGLLENGWDENNIFVYKTSEEASEKVAQLDGFIFVKGSRVCELEKSLPSAVLEKLNSPAQPEQEDDEQVESDDDSIEEQTIEEDIEDTSDDEDFDDSEDDEDFDEDYDDDFDDDFDDENFEEEDDEDEREKI